MVLHFLIYNSNSNRFISLQSILVSVSYIKYRNEDKPNRSVQPNSFIVLRNIQHTMAETDPPPYAIAAESNEVPQTAPIEPTDKMDVAHTNTGADEKPEMDNAAKMETEQQLQQEQQKQQQEYTVFVHTLRESPPKPMATTGNTYNTIVSDTLQEERDQIYPRMHSIPPSDENNFFRNLKW